MKQKILVCLSVFLFLSLSTLAGNIESEALALYSKGKYQQAIPLFRELLKNNPQDYHLKAKYGYSLYQTKQYTLAKAEFQQILSQSNNKSLKEYATKILGLISAKLPTEVESSPVSAPVLQLEETEVSTNTEGASTVLELLKTIQSKQNLAEIVPHLTHESATMLGFNFVLGLQFMGRFKDKIPAESDLQRFELLENELQKLLQRFNISELSQKNYKQPFERIKPVGRVFLKDLAHILQTYEEAPGKAKSKIKQFKDLDLATLKLEKITEQKVKIYQKNSTITWEAHQEKGLWKLHLGGIEEVALFVGS